MDFFQNGTITTLHKLCARPIEEMEAELKAFSADRPMALILPSLYSELQGPALPHIVEELKHATYISEIIVGLDQADESQFEHAKEFFSELPQNVHILWNDGPWLRDIDADLQSQNLAPTQAGKGRNAWYCMGYALALDHCEAIALHDCDITTYDRSLPARLFYPVANPAFSFEFCKGYYSRVHNDQLSGRATRLFVTPLIRALRKVVGQLDYLDFMDSFRYPLSGEFSLSRDFVKTLRIPSDWGLEVGVLSEVYRTLARSSVCQVDIADQYDHKHQDLSEDDATKGLTRMSVEIAKSLYRKLATEGITLSSEDFRSIKAAYYRIALDSTEQYFYDARINGLKYDRHKEEGSIEVFAQSVMSAGETFLSNPMESPFIPNWNRVHDAFPDICQRLLQAVRADR
ncbi:glycosyltransferase family protein [Thiosocius teredinicola]|uniref:glycosyl transferase n=1 Tax=Thiosocius teredinicola TaxID=1973002 RepID=UPI0009910FB5